MINTEQIDVQDVVYALSTSPGFAQDGVCFAARASGLYRSEDGGLTWMDAYHSLELRQALPTAAVAVSPAFLQDRAVFAGGTVHPRVFEAVGTRIALYGTHFEQSRQLLFGAPHDPRALE